MISVGAVFKSLFEGFAVSLEIFALTLLLAIPLGLVISFGSMSKFKPLKYLVKFVVWIIRGTPLMLQLILFMYGPSLIFNLPSFSRINAALIAFIINYAAYFSEIYRGGVESIPKGQYEACKVLGFTKNQTFFKIILPQVIKRILPATGNEVITLVKDTSLAQVIGVVELFRVAYNFASSRVSVTPLFVAGVFYFFMNWVVSFTFEKLEKKLSYYR
jgi:His/Glu/Gln/Arg/opine family amino acid ABC transporter permease subunit